MEDNEIRPPEETPNHSDDALDTCPSCGDLSSVAEREKAGNPDLCPICGSEMVIEDPEPLSATAPEAAAKQPTTLRTEDLLFERLKNTPPVPKQASQSVLIVILLAVLALGYGIYAATQKPVKYAKADAADSSAMADSSEILQRRIMLQSQIDSLKNAVTANANDTTAILELAIDDFDAEYWADAEHGYDKYLQLKPDDVDARVDYATSIDRAENNSEAAINQIEKALEYDPRHVRALYNAGILSLRAMAGANHKEALARARSYFGRARAAAMSRDTTIIPQLDRILAEIDSMHAPGGAP